MSVTDFFSSLFDAGDTGDQEHHPTQFVVVRLRGELRVFASWSGGYLDSDEWRLSSSILRAEIRGDVLTFFNASGSRYVLPVGAYGTAGYAGMALERLIEVYGPGELTVFATLDDYLAENPAEEPDDSAPGYPLCERHLGPVQDGRVTVPVVRRFRRSLTEAARDDFDRMLIGKTYQPTRGYYPWDLEPILQALVVRGALDPSQTKPSRPTLTSLQVDFAAQLGGREIECLDGWAELLEPVFVAVELAQERGDVSRDFYWMQIKEKFGGLRMYHPPNSEIEAACELAAERALTTCEVCGAPGEHFSDGWWKVRCPAHLRPSEWREDG